LFLTSKGTPKEYIEESLGPSQEAAKVEGAHRVADYRVLFNRAGVMTVEAVQTELAAIKERAERRQPTAKRLEIEAELGRIGREYEAHIERLRAETESPEAVEAQEQMWNDMRDRAAGTIARIAPDMPKGSPAWQVLADRVLAAQGFGSEATTVDQGETISQAAEALYGELQREGVRSTTLEGHRLRVRAFVEHCGDVALANVTRAMASDFLTAMTKGRTNRTVNAYVMTMKCVFKSARNRGRFTGENPFDGQRRKAVAVEREGFTNAEIHKLFAALPLDAAPRKHSPETALPWVVRIAAYTGMRLEEIAQLTVSDIETRGANGAAVTIIDVHNGDAAHHLKNDSSARAVPVHSELVRAGLLDYIRAIKDGPLFPGLKRRASKGGKIGARLGELFRKRLIALGMKREGLCFHSFRHTVGQRLEAAAVMQTDTACVLGHAIAGESYGTYSSGPGLKRLAAVVEAIRYDD
jgi:integrase